MLEQTSQAPFGSGTEMYSHRYDSFGEMRTFVYKTSSMMNGTDAKSLESLNMVSFSPPLAVDGQTYGDRAETEMNEG